MVSKYLLIFIILFGCTGQQSGIQYPDKIGNLQLISVVEGDSAVAEINTLHRLAVAASENLIVRYGEAGQDILYISRYENSTASKTDLEKMIKKMQSVKNSPFSYIVPMKKYKNSFMTLGLGSVHYIYQSGRYLLWYTTKQKFYNELPTELMEKYPATD